MALTKAFPRIMEGVQFSVKDFGAKGDGVTDDRAAIQAAIDHVASFGGGTVYFPQSVNKYRVASEHPSYPGHALVVLKGNGLGDIEFYGCGLKSEVFLDVGTAITSMMYWPLRLDRMVMRNMSWNANNLADFVLKADEEYHPYLHFEHTTFWRGLDTCLSLSTFVSVLTRVLTFRGQYGIALWGPNRSSSVVTSVTLNSCYALQASDYGFYTGFLTYCVFNACAVDGAVGFKTEVGYYLTGAYGTTMNGCGVEGVQRYCFVDAVRGFVINGAYMLSVGGVDSAVDYLIDLNGGKSATLSAIEVFSSGGAGYTYVLGVTAASFGSENVTVTDGSISRSETFQLANFNFDRPIMLLRGDQANRDRTFNISTASEIQDFARNRSFSTLNFTQTAQLADGTYDLNPQKIIFENINGCGTIIVQGNGADNTAVEIVSQFNDIQITNCDARIVFKDLSIVVDAGNISFDMFRVFNSQNVILDNVLIVPGFIVGKGIIASNLSNVYFINGTYAFGTFNSGVFDFDESSKLIIEDMSSAPSTGTWLRGNRIYHSSPATGGNIGFVCTASGSPGTWKTFGGIAS